MVTLEERLRSRFEWGLAADIQASDFETRVAILQAKADRSGYTIPQHILETIAHRFPSNLRELEGALTKLVAFAQLQGLEFTQELVESAVAELMPQSREIAPCQILSVITREFHVSREELLSRSRAHRISHLRQVAMYLLREKTSLSFPEIGELLGDRDHTTIMYGHEKIADGLDTVRKLKKKFNRIQEALYTSVGV